MPNQISKLEKIDKILAKVASLITQRAACSEATGLIFDAYEAWCEIPGHDHRDEPAARLYDLYENLATYQDDHYVKDEEGSLDFLEDQIAEIRSDVAHALQTACSNRGWFFESNDEESESENEDESVDEFDGEMALTKAAIDAKIANILNEIKIDDDYYFIDQEISSAELNSSKWRTYLYLRKCVLDYRRGVSVELLQVINFLTANTANKKWLAEKLLDKARKGTLEFWGSGSHEWLERSLIVDVLRRSAGMVAGVQAETDFQNGQVNIDWLYIQAQLRSPTKYLFFKLPSGSIKEGHVGAVKPKLYEAGFSSKGSPAFHKKLEEAFFASTTLAGFIIRIHNIFKLDVVSGKKSLNPDAVTRYVVDSSTTSDAASINAFRLTRLRMAGYNPTNALMKQLTQQAADLDGYSVSPVNSESSDGVEAKADTELNIRFVI